MRIAALLTTAFLTVPLFAADVAAQGSLLSPDGPFPNPPADPGAVAPLEDDFDRAQMLDQLFTTLATTDDPSLAQRTENRISAIWMDSGSATIDLLMQWSMEAIDGKDFPLALDFLDRVVSLEPGYVEGWNKRATVFFMSDEYGKSLIDLERVLAIEPRHFGALSGLGTIMRAFGAEDRAIEAYRRALELDPHLSSVKDALSEIEAEVDGPRA